MAMATRVAGDKECNGGKSNGDDKKGCGRVTATAEEGGGLSHLSHAIAFIACNFEFVASIP